MSIDELARIELAIEAEGLDPEGLPWWRRPRRLRRQLAGTLVVTALLSVVLVGTLNFFAARQLLDDGTQDQLVGVGEARARSIEFGIERLLANSSATAADLAVVDAMEALDGAFSELDDEMLAPQQDASVDDSYQTTVVDALNATSLDFDLTLADVAPTSDRTRYLQYHYTFAVPDDERRAVIDAGDGSSYSQVHAERHPYLSELTQILGAGDLLLINAEGQVVYSAEKRLDLGADLVSGPLADSNLARAFTQQLPRVPVGESVIADLELYLPGGARPVVFILAGLRRETQVIGAIAIQIPGEAIDAVTTADRQWEEVGLSSGESYLVGADGRLISESRNWIEDPSDYLDRVDDPGLASAIETFESPVGLQPVDTEPVQTASDGRQFEGTSRNYLGERTFSYATPIRASGVNWIVVADIPLDDARGPLYDYALRLGLVLLIILPVAAIVGLWMAARITRPIPPVVDAALAVARGDRNPEIPGVGRDEFGDLARRLKQMAADLDTQERALAQEFEERRQLLLTVLPERVVGADGEMSGTGGTVQEATVVAVALSSSAAAVDASVVATALAEALIEVEQLASARGIERIRATRHQYLFAAGFGREGADADVALDFVEVLTAAVRERADSEDVEAGVHVGVASGAIATGVLERGNLTFAAWGEAVRRALAIGALAQQDEVLVDASTRRAATTDRWQMSPATDVLALDGQAMDLYTFEPSDAATSGPTGAGRNS